MEHNDIAALALDRADVELLQDSLTIAERYWRLGVTGEDRSTLERWIAQAEEMQRRLMATLSPEAEGLL